LKIRLKQIILEGMRIPAGYGIAYFDYPRRCLVCYPIPLNLIVRFFKLFYYWVVAAGFPSRWERELFKARYKEETL